MPMEGVTSPKSAPRKVHGRLTLASEFALSTATSVHQVLVQPSRASPPTGGLAATATPSGSNASAQSPPPLNPGIHLDLALNIAVLQFFDAQGNVTQSFPSEKQLQAYREGVPDTVNPSSTNLSV